MTRGRAATLTAVLLGVVVGCGAPAERPPASQPERPSESPSESPSAAPGPSTSPTSEGTFDAATITALLAQARTIDRQPDVPGYDRDCGPGDGCSFGTAWTDDTDAPDGHNGCDTRNDVLRRTLSDVRFKDGSNDCDVTAGRLTDPYRGVEMAYETEGSQIHVDHLVPLAAAWDLGAAQWTPERRARFANDTALELLAVNGGANQSKGDSTPASWLPPNKPYRCEYVVRYLRATQAYDLPLTRADVDVIRGVARKC